MTTTTSHAAGLTTQSADKLAISRRLALAIGWKPKQITPVHLIMCGGGQMLVCWNVVGRPFHYTDPRVIWRIAERYNAFPTRLGGRWQTAALDHPQCVTVHEATPELAVAMAVIKAHEL